jgi:hypothetical protein
MSRETSPQRHDCDPPTQAPSAAGAIPVEESFSSFSSRIHASAAAGAEAAVAAAADEESARQV